MQKELIDVIASIQNKRIKAWRKLQTKKARTKAQRFFIEGFHLVEEAHKSDWEIATIIVREGIEVLDWMSTYELIHVTTDVFASLSATKTPQGIGAIVHMKELPLHVTQATYLLLVDAVQDPGNLGTMIRTADAAGFSGVVLGEGTVDLFNDKVIRASQGSVFHIPVLETDLTEQIQRLKENEYEIIATALDNAVDYRTLSAKGKKAIIVGNEGAGISSEILAQSDTIVKIPIYGKAESLNVTIATGILMYQCRN